MCVCVCVYLCVWCVWFVRVCICVRVCVCGIGHMLMVVFSQEISLANTTQQLLGPSVIAISVDVTSCSVRKNCRYLHTVSLLANIRPSLVGHQQQAAH